MTTGGGKPPLPFPDTLYLMLQSSSTALRPIALAGCLLVALAVAGCSQSRWVNDGAKAADNKAGKTTAARATQPRARDVAAASSITTDPAAAEQRLTEAASNETAITASQLGYFMDVHEARLRQAIAGTPVSLERGNERFTLTIPGTATFASGSAMLMSDFRPVLDSIGRVLAEFDKTLVTVLGHTDDRGDAVFNERLSQQRALAVADYLRDRGIATQRLLAVGMGETQPASDNATAQGRAANRRVEIIVKPFAKPATPEEN